MDSLRSRYRRLKPPYISNLYGAAEAAPFQNKEVDLRCNPYAGED